MTFSKKKLPKSQIVLEVKLDPEEFEPQRAEAIAALAKDLRLEGFRPGHVPLAIAEQRLGDSLILEETARLAIGNAWASIVRQENLDVIGEPEVQVLKLAPRNSLEFRIQVAILPEIVLPDYRKVAGICERRKIEVTEKDVDEALKWLRESRKVKNAALGTEEAPEATDAFAQSLGDFKDLAGLRVSIREGLAHEKELQEQSRLRQEIIQKISEQSTFEIPPILIAREQEILLSQARQSVPQVMQISFEEYLKNIGKTEQELLDSFAPEAEQRVKRFLAVREVARRESISPTKEEIDREADIVLRHYATAQRAAKDLDPRKLREYTEGMLRHEKTLQFLEGFVKQ